MKTVLRVFSALALLSLSAVTGFGDDNYLYWMVTTEADSNPYSVAFTYARIRAVDVSQPVPTPTGSFLANGYFDSAASWGADVFADGVSETKLTGTTISPIFADLGEFASTAYGFVLELCNDSDEVIKSSSIYNYADLAAYITSSKDPDYRPEKFSSWQVVPEPTSGLLVLLGLAGLTLRRKLA